MIDATEFSDLVQRCKGRAFGMAYQMLCSSDLANDIVADAIMLAWIHRTQFRGDGSMEVWFMRIVKNRALEWRRAQMRRPTYQLDAVLPLRQLDSCRNIEDAMIVCQRNERVRRTVQRLPPVLQTPIRLFYWDALQYDAAGERLGISTAVFKSRLLRARSIFRVIWQEKGSPSSAGAATSLRQNLGGDWVTAKAAPVGGKA
jgi:RNA polymerase sigma factor (sigma-70 family)